jgi:hypothetical protein
MTTQHSSIIMGVKLATPPNRRTDDVQLRRRGMSLNVGNPPPRNASSVVPKCHKKSRVHRPAFALSAVQLPLS